MVLPEHGMTEPAGSNFRPAWPPLLCCGTRAGPGAGLYYSPEQRRSELS